MAVQDRALNDIDGHSRSNGLRRLPGLPAQPDSAVRPDTAPATATRDDARALFIDDGGESSSVTMLCALCLDAAVAEGAVGSIEKLRDELRAFLPAFAHEEEFHAVRLARRLVRSEREQAKVERRPVLRTYERAFIFQHTVHALAGLPGHPRIYTVAMRVEGGRILNEPRGTDVRRLMIGLLRWVVSNEPVISLAAIDRGHQFRHNRSAYSEAAKDCGGALLSALHPVNSKDHLLVQMVDLACYAAFKAIRPDADDDRNRIAGLKTWYRDALAELWAPGCGEDGVKHLPRT